MNVERRAVGDVWVLEIEGNITIGKGDLKLREAVREPLERERPRVVLDLRQVGYIDSAGLGEILASKRRAAQSGGDVKLLAPPPKVNEILKASRLAEAFEIYTDESEAIASF